MFFFLFSVRLETCIRDAFVQKEHVVVSFFDLDKACDTTWMYGILCDLHEEGMKSRLATFIESFIVERSIRIRVRLTLYEVFEQAQGVPQGALCPQHCLILKSIALWIV